MVRGSITVPSKYDTIRTTRADSTQLLLGLMLADCRLSVELLTPPPDFDVIIEILQEKDYDRAEHQLALLRTPTADSVREDALAPYDWLIDEQIRHLGHLPAWPALIRWADLHRANAGGNPFCSRTR